MHSIGIAEQALSGGVYVENADAFRLEAEDSPL